MKNNKKTNVMRILDQDGKKYDVHLYEVADGRIDGVSVAKKIGKAPEQVFKTLVTRGNSGEHFVFIIPVVFELDMKKTAEAAGEKKIELIPVKDIQKTTGYIRGGCSPVGMKKQFRTWIHSSYEDFDTIIISAGRTGVQIEISGEELRKVIHAESADLIK